MLAGAGHALLYTLARAAAFRERGHRLTVVGTRPFWYSGLATGMLGGGYTPAEDQIDVARLACMNGAQFIDSKVIRIDAERRRLELANGTGVRYDVLGINLGSEVAPLPGAADGAVYPVKPIANLARLRRDLEAAFDRRAAPRVVVAGGGATGCELAANVAALARKRGARVEVTLVASSTRLAPQLPPRASAALERALVGLGVAVRLPRRVVDAADGALLDDGTVLAYDALVNATGLRPSSLIGDSGLPTDARGALLVDRQLRSLGDPLVFGGGDCVAIEGCPLPMIGVYAIREAPVLWRNLLAAADGQPLARFTPQRRYLWIMNFGDGTGLAARGRWWWHGRTAFRLKDWLDRRFLARYRC